MDGWKPVKKEKLFEVLDRAAEKLSKNEKVIDIELAGELIRVPVYRIRYADMLENYVTIHAAQDYTFKMMLGDLQNELDDGTEILLPQLIDSVVNQCAIGHIFQLFIFPNQCNDQQKGRSYSLLTID